MGALSALWFGSAAQACMAADDYYAHIHSALPRPLPRGVIIADVELETLPEQRDYRPYLLTHGIRARVRRMVQGAYDGEFILVRPLTWSSCDSMFENGRAGFLMAVPRRTEGGTLVVDPIKVWSADGYRLPDGFEVAQETFQRAALPPLPQPHQRRSFAPIGLSWSVALLLLSAAAVAVWAVLRRRSR